LGKKEKKKEAGSSREPGISTIHVGGENHLHILETASFVTKKRQHKGKGCSRCLIARKKEKRRQSYEEGNDMVGVPRIT